MNMRTLYLWALLLFAGGGVAGFVAGIFFFPFLFPPPEVNEMVDESVHRNTVAEGTFIHVNPADPVHYGKGGVTLYDNLLHLKSDFEVGPGPKFHVYLVPDAKVTTKTKVRESMYVDLGRIKSFSGSQNYDVPGGLHLDDYGSVVIWCEQFNVLISAASLEKP